MLCNRSIKYRILNNILYDLKSNWSALCWFLVYFFFVALNDSVNWSFRCDVTDGMLHIYIQVPIWNMSQFYPSIPANECEKRTWKVMIDTQLQSNTTEHRVDFLELIWTFFFSLGVDDFCLFLFSNSKPFPSYIWITVIPYGPAFFKALALSLHLNSLATTK